MTNEMVAQRERGRLEAELSPALAGKCNPRNFDVCIGRIVSISGSEATVRMDVDPDHLAHLQYPQLQIGSLIKTRTPHSCVFGVISGLTIPVAPEENSSDEVRLARVDLLGERLFQPDDRPGQFQRGISFYPTLADEAFAATPEDLADVYMSPTMPALSVGTIHQDRAIPAYVMMDELLGKHFAILGSTGTGKSCALAVLLREILSEHLNGHILLLDPHGEYAQPFGDAAEVLTPDNLQLPYWLLTFEEIEELVLDDDDETESSILHEVIVAAKRLYAEKDENIERITVDTPIPYRLGDVARLLDERAGRLDRPTECAPYLRLQARFAALQSDPRFGFIFPGLAVRDNMARIVSQLFRIPVGSRPITIVDLSGVPSEILNVVVSVLCRMAFDFALWSERSGSAPILVVCEEAHRYAPRDPTRGFEPTKRALSRIAKEGRKYGVSLGLVTQRPSELAAELVSQCNTIFALRLANEKDQRFVRGVLSEAGVGLMDFLPSLRNSEAIAVGEGVPVPVRLCFHELTEKQRPKGGTAKFSKAWRTEEKNELFVEDVVYHWRWQRR